MPSSSLVSGRDPGMHRDYLLGQPRYIVTRTDGRPIPEDEPCFIVRGQDAFALKAIQAYIEMTLDVVSEEVTGELLKHRERVRLWHKAHPPKLPD